MKLMRQMSIEKYVVFEKKNEILNVNKFQKDTFLGEELPKKKK